MELKSKSVTHIISTRAHIASECSRSQRRKWTRAGTYSLSGVGLTVCICWPWYHWQLLVFSASASLTCVYALAHFSARLRLLLGMLGLLFRYVYLFKPLCKHTRGNVHTKLITSFLCVEIMAIVCVCMGNNFTSQLQNDGSFWDDDRRYCVWSAKNCAQFIFLFFALDHRRLRPPIEYVVFSLRASWQFSRARVHRLKIAVCGLSACGEMTRVYAAVCVGIAFNSFDPKSYLKGNKSFCQ